VREESFRPAATRAAVLASGLAMHRYVIEREVPNVGSLTDEQLREISLGSIRALGELGPKIQWIHSYVTDNKVYCVYLALDEETIRTVFFYDHAESDGLCRDRGVLAYTVPGSRVVRVCPLLADLVQRSRIDAEIAVIHEILHTLGLTENPPRSSEITAQVLSRCGAD
jgi:hypothetical protein